MLHEESMSHEESMTTPAGRLMLVHAHPDDETSGTGATMARYAALGAQVTLVTCTLGEEGEVLVEGLAHLGSTQQDALGTHRLSELTAAMAELGVTDFVRLGGDHRYRDSGMRYGDNGEVVPVQQGREGTFWTADLLEAANELVPLIRDRRPQVLITYNEYGGYGHPDHIQAHRVAMYATQLAAARSYRLDLGEPWQVERVLWTAWSADTLRAAVRAARDAGDDEFFAGLDPDGELPPMVTPDELIDCVIDARDHAGQKLAALRAHATQVNVDDGFFRWMTSSQEWAVEHYRLAMGTPFPSGADDLFAGLDGPGAPGPGAPGREEPR